MVVASSVDHYVSNDVISEGLSMEQLLRTKQNWTCLSLMLITWNFHNTIVDVPREHMQLHLHLYYVCIQPFWSSKILPLSPSPPSLNSSFVPHTVLVLTYYIAQGIYMFVCDAIAPGLWCYCAGLRLLDFVYNVVQCACVTQNNFPLFRATFSFLYSWFYFYILFKHFSLTRNPG